MRAPRSIPAIVIANGASLSEAIGPLDGVSLVGLKMSAGWDAAPLTFQVSDDDDDYDDLYYDGAEYSVASAGVVAGGRVALDPVPFLGARYVKVRSGTTGSAVNQSAQRSLAPIVRDLGE